MSTRTRGLSERPPKIDVKYVDRPMECCGLGMGSGFHYDIDTGKVKRDRAFGGEYYATRSPTKEDQLVRIRQLINYKENNERNCVLISLAEEAQDAAISAAEETGFITIHRFYNPNSGNYVRLMAHTTWLTKEEYRAYRGSYDDDEDDE